MNPTQQQARKTAVDALRADVEIVLSGFAKEIKALTAREHEFTLAAVGAERTVRMAVTTRLQREIETESSDRRAFVARSFYFRWRWLLVGR